MGETVETGNNLWPVVLLGLYWAYLLIWHERQQNRQKALFSSGLPPPNNKERDGRNGGAPLSAANTPLEFDEENFLIGAANAYEFILEAYAAGNLDALAQMVSPEVLQAFAEDIHTRQAKGERLLLTFVSLKDPLIVRTKFDDAAAEITVRFEADIFVSEGTSATSDEPVGPLAAIDVWTFSRTRKAKGRSWTLIATETA